MVVKRAAGLDYPRSYVQLLAWFDEDRKCLDYLDWHEVARDEWTRRREGRRMVVSAA